MRIESKIADLCLMCTQSDGSSFDAESPSTNDDSQSGHSVDGYYSEMERLGLLRDMPSVRASNIEPLISKIRDEIRTYINVEMSLRELPEHDVLEF